MSLSLAASPLTARATRRQDVLVDLRLRWHEWLLLAIGVVEICLQVDNYLMYHERDAQLGSIGGLNISVLSISLAYLYFFWIARLFVVPVQPKNRLYLNWPMVLYVFAVAFSVLVAAVKLLALFELALILQSFALFFFIANRMKTRADIVKCILLLAASLYIQSTIIILQTVFAEAGSRFNLGPIAFVVWPDGRPGGCVHSPVSAGSLLALMWVPVMALALTARQRFVSWICLLAITLGILAILFTQTRGAFITVVVGSLCIGALMSRRLWLPKWSIAAAVALVIIGAYPLFQLITNRVTSGDEGSAAARAHLAAIAIRTIGQAPFLGHGAANCHIACEDVSNQSAFRSLWYYTIHSKYLVVWVETGLLGLVAFLMMMGNGIRHGMGAWKRKCDPMLATLGLGLTAAILGHMVHMMVDVFNARSQVQLLWFVLATAAATYRVSLSDQTHGGLQHG